MDWLKPDDTGLIECDFPSLRFVSIPAKKYLNLCEIINFYDFIFVNPKILQFISQDVNILLENDNCRIIWPNNEKIYYKITQDIFVDKLQFIFIIDKGNIILIKKACNLLEYPGKLMFYYNTTDKINKELIDKNIIPRYFEKYRLLVYYSFFMEYDETRFSYLNGHLRYSMRFCPDNEIEVEKI